MILVNNYDMKYSKCERYNSGVFYCTKRVLKFQSREEIITDDDLMNLLHGVINLIKQTTEIEIEKKYRQEIYLLKNKLKKLEVINK